MVLSIKMLGGAAVFSHFLTLGLTAVPLAWHPGPQLLYLGWVFPSECNRADSGGDYRFKKLQRALSLVFFVNAICGIAFIH